MRRFIGIAGLIALGVMTYISVSNIMASVPPPGSAPSTPLIERTVPQEDLSPRLGSPTVHEGEIIIDPGARSFSKASRSVGITDIITTDDGMVLFMGNGVVYHRDDPDLYAWVIRVIDRKSRDILFEWYYQDQAFWVEAGERVNVDILEMIPGRFKPGEYVLELSFSSLSEANDPLRFFAVGKHPFLIE
ncbi:hypothetical protein BH23PLA1_BH23PLA1_18630 [soil metagenome]